LTSIHHPEIKAAYAEQHTFCPGLFLQVIEHDFRAFMNQLAALT